MGFFVIYLVISLCLATSSLGELKAGYSEISV